MKIVSWCYILYPLTSLCWMCMALTTTTLKSNKTRSERLGQQIIQRRKQMEARWNHFIQDIRDSDDDINLLAAVGSPLPPDVRPVTGPFGRRGRPAVEFTPQSYVGRWAKDLIPIPFYYDFGMKVTLYLQSINGGVLFSILEADHSRMKLGLSILRVGKDSQCIELIYRNNDRSVGSKELTATFILPKFVKNWIVFSITVRGQVVTLFFNGCHKIYSKVFQMKRVPLQVLPTDPLFVGMAGWYIEKPSFFGALYDLTIYKDVNKAVPLCVKEKQAEYELVNFQENTNTQRHQEDRTDNEDDDDAEDDDTTTANIIEGLKRIQSGTNQIQAETDPSSGKRKGGSLVNPFHDEVNEKAKRKDSASTPSTNPSDNSHGTNSDGAYFNPFAENTDDSEDTRNEKATPKPIRKDVDDSEEFNPFIENIDDSSEETDISSEDADISNEDADISSKGTDISDEDADTKEDEFNPFKDVTDNPSETHKSGELFNPVNDIGALDNSDKTEPQPRVNISSTLSSKIVTSQKTTKKAKIGRPTTAAKILTIEYRETGDVVTTTVPPKRKLNKLYLTTISNIKTTQTPSVRVTLANTKHTTSTQQTINKLKTKTKTNKFVKEHSTSLVKEKVQKPVTVDTEGNKPSTTNIKLANEHTSPSDDYKNTRTSSHLSSKRVKNNTTIRTTHPSIGNTIVGASNNSLQNSLKKTLFNKLIKLMKTQRSSTNSYKEIVTNVVPTEQIIKLAKTLSNKKFKELLPKITYSVNRELRNTTSIPVIITEPVITNKPPSTPKTIRNSKTTSTTMGIRTIESYDTSKDNNIVVNELALKNTVTSADYSFPVDVITNMANTAAPTEKVILLNDKSKNNNLVNKMKVQSDKLDKLKTTHPPLNYKTESRVVIKELEEELTRIGDTIRKISGDTATPERRKRTFNRTIEPLSKIDESADLNVVNIVDTRTRTSATITTSAETPPPAVDTTTKTKQTKAKGELGGEENQNYEGLTVDDITRHVIEKLKANKKENGDLLRDEERIRQVTQQVLEELKISGKLYERDGTANPIVYLKGEKGEKGETIKGTPGRTGLPGVIGLRGPSGERGPPGKPGIDGDDGRPGLTGLRGQRGLKGDQGEVGSQGIPGVSYKEDERPERILEYGGEGNKKQERVKNADKESRDENLISNQGTGIGAKALIIYTMQDLFMMTEMFPIGSFVFVTSSSELYLRGINGWMQIPTVLVSDSAAGYLSAPIAHKIQPQAKPSPRPIDRLLIEGYLVLPPSGINVPRPYLLMVALNQPFSGQIAGTIGADYLCMKQANSIGLDGTTFRAFLSSDFMAVKYIVESKYSNLPIANFKGEMLFSSVLSIFNSSGYAAFNPEIPIISFDVKDVRIEQKWPIKKIWHGSHASGEVNYKGLNCDNWRTASTDATATAASIMTYTPALNEEVVKCNNELIVLCIQSKLS